MVYALKLTHGKYYIGFTNNICKRLKDHLKGYGSQWTKLYQPIDVLYISQGSAKDENNLTLQYMKKYNWTNVRGGIWSSPNISKCPREIYEYQRANYNVNYSKICSKCSRYAHYNSSC